MAELQVNDNHTIGVYGTSAVHLSKIDELGYGSLEDLVIANSTSGFQSKRAMDMFGRGEIQPPFIANFIDGCGVFAAEIKKERPDILFVPLRGASPMSWTVKHFLEDSGVMPTVVELPIGSHTYIGDPYGRQAVLTKGVRPSDKARIVKETIDELVQTKLYIPGESSLMLVDEVQNGSTITDVSRHILAGMQGYGDKNELDVFAFRDNRSKDRWMPKYLNIAKDTNVRSLGTTVTSLFTVDSRQLLDGIYNTNPDLPPSTETLIKIKNAPARRLFKALYEVYVSPEQSLDELSVLIRGGVQEKFGKMALTDEVVATLNDPVPVRKGKAVTEVQLYRSWEQLARYMIKHHGTKVDTNTAH